MIEIKTRFEDSDELESLIIKVHEKDWMSIILIQYSGGPFYETLCGKFKISDHKNQMGYFSKELRPVKWIYQWLDGKIINCDEEISDSDYLIIGKMAYEIWWDYLYCLDNSKEPIVIRVQKEYFNPMKDGVYRSEDWDSEGISYISQLINLK